MQNHVHIEMNFRRLVGTYALSSDGGRREHALAIAESFGIEELRRRTDAALVSLRDGEGRNAALADLGQIHVEWAMLDVLTADRVDHGAGRVVEILGEVLAVTTESLDANEYAFWFAGFAVAALGLTSALEECPA